MSNCPRLPAEIVREILFLLELPVEEDWEGFYPLDLLACSLVCTTWYHEANTLLASQKNPLSTVFDGHAYTTPNIMRLASLLVESHRLGLKYHEKINVFHINTACLIDDQSLYDHHREAAIFAILSLPLLNLHNLILDVKDLPPPATPAFFHISLFFTRSQPLLTTITRFRLTTDLTDTPSPTLHTLVSTLAPSLDVLMLDVAALPPPLYNALALCNHLTQAQLINALATDAALLLGAWPDLRRFRLKFSNPGDMDPLVWALAYACHHLTDIEIRANHRGNREHHVSSAALRVLLERSRRRITRLVLYSTQIDEVTMPDLLRYCPHLRHLELRWCTGVTGASLVNGRLAEREVWWSEMRDLSLKDCSGLEHGFLRKVATACPRLGTLVLDTRVNRQHENVEFLTRERYRLMGPPVGAWKRSP